LSCGKFFQNKKRPLRLQRAIWNKYVWRRQTINQLAKEYKKSLNWIRTRLSEIKIIPKRVRPQPTVIIADATFFKRTFGLCVIRSSHLKQNIYWKEIENETISVYQQAKTKLENQGWQIMSVVLDGRPGVRAVFNDIPVQMCHYHQKAIINRYLTTKPKLEASIELRKIVQFLCQTNEKEFTKKLNIWHKKWSAFLKERTHDPINPKRWYYTHRRLRSAYRSLNINLPYLFTYKEYPKLNIPNTTNSLDGYFSHLKDLVKIHRGITKKLKLKIIDEILSK